MGLYARAIFSYYPDLEEVSRTVGDYLSDVPVPETMPLLRDATFPMAMMCTLDGMDRVGRVLDAFAEVEDKTGMGREVRTAFVTGIARPLWELSTFKVETTDGQMAWDPLAQSFPDWVKTVPGYDSKNHAADLQLRMNEPWWWAGDNPRPLRLRLLRCIFPDAHFAKLVEMCDMRRVVDPD